MYPERRNITMHDDVRKQNDKRSSGWPFGKGSDEGELVLTGIILGVLFGGAVGLMVGGFLMMAVGISMGSGVGWGLSRQYGVARERGSIALLGMAVGGVLGGLAGALIAAFPVWDVFVMLAIAVGIAFGTNAGQRIGESRTAS
jgi:hypothetical protein